MYQTDLAVKVEDITHSSATVSLNGRMPGSDGWEAALLVGGSTFVDVTVPTADTSYVFNYLQPNKVYTIRVTDPSGRKVFEDITFVTMPFSSPADGKYCSNGIRQLFCVLCRNKTAVLCLVSCVSE